MLLSVVRRCGLESPRGLWRSCTWTKGGFCTLLDGRRLPCCCLLLAGGFRARQSATWRDSSSASASFFFSSHTAPCLLFVISNQLNWGDDVIQICFKRHLISCKEYVGLDWGWTSLSWFPTHLKMSMNRDPSHKMDSLGLVEVVNKIWNLPCCPALVTTGLSFAQPPHPQPPRFFAQWCPSLLLTPRHSSGRSCLHNSISPPPPSSQSCKPAWTWSWSLQSLAPSNS